MAAHAPTDRTGTPLEVGPRTLAAVDLGSNSFHMVVARLGPGGVLQVRDRLREPVRLGARLDARGRLPRQAWKPALECLERFGERLRGLPPEAVRAVGTNTLRRARNAPAFLETAARALGHRIEVISGIEEARLVYLGVAAATPDDGRTRLVVDVGGGSTEMVVGSGDRARDKESLYMGCVSQTLAYFPGGRVTAARLQRAVLAAAVELEPVAPRFRRGNWQRVLGASGTVRAVRDAIATLDPRALHITPDGLAALRDAVIAARRPEGLARLGVRADRQAVFAGGLSVLLALFEQLEIESMEASDGALRDGLLQDLVGRIRHRDARGPTVAALARRYHVDLPHARRVARLACALHEQVAGEWALTEADQVALLEWAALLHEIGLDVAHAEYHKHGAYILQHGDLPGFSREEQRALAALVRVHRRKFAVEVFDALPPPQRRAAMRLAVLLRLAVTLHRSRTPAGPPVPRVRVEGTGLRVQLPTDWLRAHPLTQADLAQEAAFLAAAGLRLRFGRRAQAPAA